MTAPKDKVKQSEIDRVNLEEAQMTRMFQVRDAEWSKKELKAERKKKVKP
jgi:hypothetical protein